MKTKWTDKFDCKYAIKVIHSTCSFPIKMELYNRDGKCVFRTKDACPEHDGCYAGFQRSYAACVRFANDHGNCGELIYLQNPFEMRCANIKI